MHFTCSLIAKGSKLGPKPSIRDNYNGLDNKKFKERFVSMNKLILFSS